MVATAPPPTHDLKFAVLAVDTVVLAIIDGVLSVRLIEVKGPEWSGMKGLPGGLIQPSETAEEAARRHVRQKAGIERLYVEQVYTFSAIGRDPRGRVVSVGHLGLMPEPDALAAAATDWRPTWVPVRRVPRLAYDHNEIVRVSVERLQARLRYSNIANALLPASFSLTELQTCYEIVLGRALDKRNFRRKVLGLDLLKETGETAMEGAHRPAALYRFATRKPMVVDIL